MIVTRIAVSSSHSLSSGCGKSISPFFTSHSTTKTSSFCLLTSLRSLQFGHFPSPEGRTENSPGPKAFGPENHAHNGIALKAPPAHRAGVFLHRHSGRTASRGRPNRDWPFDGPVSLIPNCVRRFLFLECHRVAFGERLPFGNNARKWAALSAFRAIFFS
jgi:hypothetical protein